MDQQNKLHDSLCLHDSDPNGPEALQTYLAKQDNLENFDIADLLRFLGDHHRYQKLVMMFLTTFSLAMGVVCSNLPFVFYEPEFMCNFGDETFVSCSKDQACANVLGFKTVVQRTSIVSEFGLYCDKADILINGQALYFLLSAFAASAALMVSDVLGRLPGLYIMCSGFVLGSFISYISPSFFGIMFGLGVSQTFVLMSLGLTSVYINEIIGKLIRL